MSKIKVGQYITVKDLSEKISIPVIKIIGQLMQNGLSVTINDTIDFDTAEIIADDFGFELELTDEQNKNLNSDLSGIIKSKDIKSRPPVVTIMGHVDHGKTSLLDYIRSSNVASGEAGGITQNITAYQVNIKVYDKQREITFIDTPGHKAFAKMRQHGSTITDLIILVVAADDGVKPQTSEVIEYAKKENVPIIVALNKIDTPGSNPENVKRQLSDAGLVSEEWGGKTVIVPISAKSGNGVKELLEHVVLQSDLLELKTEFDTPAKGVVIESHVQKGLGPVALILVTSGILNHNDNIVFESNWGKIRTMEDTLGKQIKSAGPSMPVRVAGIKFQPEFGDNFSVVKSEKEAKELIEGHDVNKNRLIKSLDKHEDKKILKFILKAETQGTLEALTSSIKELENNQVKISFAKVGIGSVSDSDADLASSTQSIIVAFRVNILTVAKKVIEIKKIEVFQSEIIYEILEQVKDKVASQTEKEFEDVNIGRMKILAIFYSKGSHQVVGGEVVEGKIANNSYFKISKQENSPEGKITTIQIEKTSVDEVLAGRQCGISVEFETKLEQNDIIEIYNKIEKKG